jgi:hypothetical protein
MLPSIALRIAGVGDNTLEKHSIDQINKELDEADHGMNNVVSVFDKYGLDVIDSNSGKSSFDIKFNYLPFPIRNVFLKFKDGKGKLVLKSTPTPMSPERAQQIQNILNPPEPEPEPNPEPEPEQINLFDED